MAQSRANLGSFDPYLAHRRYLELTRGVCRVARRVGGRRGGGGASAVAARPGPKRKPDVSECRIVYIHCPLGLASPRKIYITNTQIRGTEHRNCRQSVQNARENGEAKEKENRDLSLWSRERQRGRDADRSIDARRPEAESGTQIAVKRKAERERANAIAELSLSRSRVGAARRLRPPRRPSAVLRYLRERRVSCLAESLICSLPALSPSALCSLSLPLPLSLRPCVFQFVCARMCAFLLSVRARVSERGVDGARIAR